MSHAWMPLAIDDYLADTRHLTTLEHGAYLLLIMRYWQKAGLPDDDRMVQRISGLNDAQWAESRDVLLGMFQLGPDGYAAFERAQGLHRRRSIPRPMRRAIYDRDGFKCAYCGDVTGPFEIDHRMPWSRGGRHDEHNLCISCQSCNAIKGALTDEEFISAISGDVQ